MPTILDVMPQSTRRRMMTPELTAELESYGAVIYCPDVSSLTPEAYGELWQSADAVLSGWGVRPPPAEVFRGAERLKIIGHTAGSIKMYPREVIEQGIVVSTARSGLSRTVGEYCLLSALTLLRRLPAYTDMSENRKPLLATANGRPAVTLFQRTVGLVGYGYVAREFRALLKPFGCHVKVYDPYLSAAAAAEAEVEQVPLDELLTTSQVVSLHVPDIPSTRGMIGTAELALIRDGSVLINSSRGRVVDTNALTTALATGRFLAALDVTDPEPLPADHPLRFMPNVIVTPHVAGPTEDELPRMTRIAVEDIGRVLRGEPALHAVSLAGYDLMSF
jgi:phosphoglycerate dehydrogenase-like enzyme